MRVRIDIEKAETFVDGDDPVPAADEKGAAWVRVRGSTVLAPFSAVAKGGGDAAVLLTTAGTLGPWSAQLARGTTADVYWLLVLDAAELPNDGDVTARVIDACEISHSYASGELADGGSFVGVAVRAGAVIVLSSTGWSGATCTLTKVADGIACAHGEVRA